MTTHREVLTTASGEATGGRALQTWAGAAAAVIVGGVLMFAAIAKGIDLVSGTTGSGARPEPLSWLGYAGESIALSWAAAVFEAVVAIALLRPRWRKYGRRLATGLVGLFCLYHVLSFAFGTPVADCGCFGIFRASHQALALVAGAMGVALVATAPDDTEMPDRRADEGAGRCDEE